MLRKILVLSLPWLLVAVTAFARSNNEAKDLQNLKDQAGLVDFVANRSYGNEAVLESFSKQLNVPEAKLQAEKKNTGFTFSQLFIGNSLASASGKSFDQISQEIKSGKEWEAIAKSENVDLGKIAKELKRTNREAEKARAKLVRENPGKKTNTAGAAQSVLRKTP